MKTLRNAIIIAIAGSCLGLAVNAARISSGKGLSTKMPWPDNRQIKQLETPPSFQPGTDSLISLEEAYNFFLSGKVIFLDARDPEDYVAGHIKGAINMPFEQWDTYWGSVKPKLDSTAVIVSYCGGLDCELSLFEARELKELGYKNALIFFGGWIKWQDAKLPDEKTEK
jgi:rhodanese-related sulfurtransferase